MPTVTHVEGELGPQSWPPSPDTCPHSWGSSSRFLDPSLASGRGWAERAVGGSQPPPGHSCHHRGLTLLPCSGLLVSGLGEGQHQCVAQGSRAGGGGKDLSLVSGSQAGGDEHDSALVRLS